MKHSLILSLTALVVTASAMEKEEPEITKLNPRRSGQPMTVQQTRAGQLKPATTKVTQQDLANFQQEQQNLMNQQQQQVVEEESSSQEEPRNKKWYQFWKK